MPKKRAQYIQIILLSCRFIRSGQKKNHRIMWMRSVQKNKMWIVTTCHWPYKESNECQKMIEVYGIDRYRNINFYANSNNNTMQSIGKVYWERKVTSLRRLLVFFFASSSFVYCTDGRREPDCPHVRVQQPVANGSACVLSWIPTRRDIFSFILAMLPSNILFFSNFFKKKFTFDWWLTCFLNDKFEHVCRRT